jgi:LPXTG-site transpeptidase (sortase) family protein
MHGKRHLPWIILLILGICVTARPLARRARRAAFHWNSARLWEQSKTLPSAVGEGDPIAWLTVSSANLDLLVTKGSDQLNRSPGLETLGQATVILAHRDTHFHGLEKCVPGDTIEIEQRDGTRQTYRITDRIIAEAADTEKVLAGFRTKPCLILLTCYPFTYIGPAPNRILFLAEPMD